MTTRRPLLLGALAASLTGTTACAQESPPADFSGEWHGLLDAGATKLRLRLVVEGGAATLFSVDQGDAPIAAEDLDINGDRIAMRFPAVNGRFEGRMRAGRIEGTWSQGGSLPLVFAREEVAAAPEAPLTQAGLAALRAEVGSPAMGAAAMHRDGRRVDFADGVRALGREERVTTADVWHLGSITKSMTATLVARCVEAGEISWDDRVGDVLGAAAPDMRGEYRDATFRHLLSHRSGLPANISIVDFMQFRREEADARGSRVLFAQKALAQAPAGPMTETFLYSNSGFVIAGAMLEARLGKSWEELITARVFAPLGMSGAGFGAPDQAGAHDQPAGHGPNMLGRLSAHPAGSRTTDNPAVLGPAGRAHAPFEDVLKYLAAHRDRTDFLRVESWDMLHTPPFGGDYAMGWVRRGDALWHNGSNTLWYAEVSFDPVRGVAGAAAVNDGRADHVAPAVGRALAGAMAAVD